MRKVLSLLLIIFVCGIIMLISCKKEYSCENCGGTASLANANKPPIAIAGIDQAIGVPLDSLSLDGSSSSDPDGTISAWFWRKISGPASFLIVKPNSAKTIVKNLIAGTYQFELKVTDNGGLSAKDTLQVVVSHASPTNRPPIANAGTDQTVTLPANTVTLDGTGSTDPDNNITNYQWTKISGPGAPTITTSNASRTQINALTEGVYQFELMVTDAGGLFSKDTVQVTVNSQFASLQCGDTLRPLVSARLIPIGRLSTARYGMAVASAGNKILFAGGYALSSGPSSRVDIYDALSQSWSTAELCAGRYSIAAVAAGNEIFFAGGEASDGTWPVDSVDILDLSTGTWRVDHLSKAGNTIAAAVVGNKVLFAGGDGGFTSRGRETRVDIYDLVNRTWSTASLSEDKRGEHAAVTLNDKVYFAGGETWRDRMWHASSEIDVYDNATNTWSTSSMQEGKLFLSAVAVSGKIYWAGGLTGDQGATQPSCKVEISDGNPGNSSIQYLSTPESWWIDGGQNAVVKDNKIIFYRPQDSNANKFDIYDITTNKWSIGILSQPTPQGASIISVNNTIYIAGGFTGNNVYSNQVWILQF